MRTTTSRRALLRSSTTPLLLSFGLGLFASPTVSAQEEPERILSDSALKVIRKKAEDWIEWELRVGAAESPRERAATRKKKLKAQEAFVKDLEKRSSDGDLLASLPDLRAIFAYSLPYKSERGSGIPRFVRDSDDVLVGDHVLQVPKSYDSDESMGLVISLPSREGDEWADPMDHVEAAWNGSTFLESAMLAVPDLDPGLVFDPLLAPDLPNAQEIQRNRLKAVLGTVRGVREEYRVDYDRLILDCGRGSSFYGLRYATYYPQSLGGLVLRDPQPYSDETRLGSLAGLPILLLATDQNRSVCESMKATLDGFVDGACQIIEAKGEYPYRESLPEIDAFLATARRDVMPRRVVVEPNSPYFRNAYWVRLGAPEPIVGVPVELRPRVVVEADKEANRIRIEARGVTDVTLQLNDHLVDLDKPVTIELNGKASTHEFRRQLSYLIDSMMRRQDPAWLFTAEYTTPVVADDENK